MPKYLFPFLKLQEFTEGSDLGGAPGSADTTSTETQTTESTSTETTGSPDAPKSMLDAINQAVPGPDAQKTPEELAAVAETEAAKAKPAEQKPENAEDLTVMPEGLSPKAQERFQKLANNNKELQSRLEQTMSAVEPFREVLQNNGVTQDQFHIATGYIGMINKGDLQGALKILDEERRHIALAMGKPLAGVDAFEQFPDLREAVETFQITEDRAMEIARSRTQQNAQQQQVQQRQAQQETQQRTQEEHNQGLKAVDDFCNSMKSKDIDYAKIESILLPKIQEGMLQGIHPKNWARVVRDAYQLIKDTAGTSKSNGTTTAPLRPTGSASPSQAPKSMFEAMFPRT